MVSARAAEPSAVHFSSFNSSLCTEYGVWAKPSSHFAGPCARFRLLPTPPPQPHLILSRLMRPISQSGWLSRADPSMPPVAETRVLFIPYRPSQSSKQAPETEISLQKHAAREYHRKAKLLRHAARPSRLAAHPRGQTKQTRTRSNALPTREPQNLGDDEDTPAISRRARRQNFPGTNAFRIRRYTPSSPSPHDIGVGQLDPFSVSIRRNAPRYVQEMLDHGKHSYERF